MTEAHPAHSTGGASRDDEGATAALGLAEWLGLAATLTFAIMALLTGLGGSPMEGSVRPGTRRRGRNVHHVLRSSA